MRNPAHSIPKKSANALPETALSINEIFARYRAVRPGLLPSHLSARGRKGAGRKAHTHEGPRAVKGSQSLSPREAGGR
jgi:hypothetical protein